MKKFLLSFYSLSALVFILASLESCDKKNITLKTNTSKSNSLSNFKKRPIEIRYFLVHIKELNKAIDIGSIIKNLNKSLDNPISSSKAEKISTILNFVQKNETKVDGIKKNLTKIENLLEENSSISKNHSPILNKNSTILDDGNSICSIIAFLFCLDWIDLYRKTFEIKQDHFNYLSSLKENELTSYQETLEETFSYFQAILEILEKLGKGASIEEIINPRPKELRNLKSALRNFKSNLAYLT